MIIRAIYYKKAATITLRPIVQLSSNTFILLLQTLRLLHFQH